jgi:hypothetical protein
MANHSIENFPQRYARVGGVLYLAIIVLGAFAEGFVTNKLVVPGDPTSEPALCLGQRSFRIGSGLFCGNPDESSRCVLFFNP